MSAHADLKRAAHHENLARIAGLKPNPWAGSKTALKQMEREIAEAGVKAEAEALAGQVASFHSAQAQSEITKAKYDETLAALSEARTADQNAARLHDECARQFAWGILYSEKPVKLKADGTPAEPPQLSTIAAELWKKIIEIKCLTAELKAADEAHRRALAPIASLINLIRHSRYCANANADSNRPDSIRWRTHARGL